ncbi:sensor histidine kinase [Pararhizobium sp.]|uniref:sensor histidine kinase n=1 Tax=Pararhizobium sp. TaxID=1977563 RepID=UPI002723FC38|nr:sensor histidine kinase [Pararhizobium sp.]MDO9414978.1 sensor histidine kinase [Pararhizobium sp.]
MIGRTEQDLDLGELTALALLRTKACLIYQDCDLNILAIRNLPEFIALPHDRPATDADIFGAPEATRLLDIKTRLLDNGQFQDVEIDVPDHRGTQSFRVQMERCEQNGSTGILSVISDITDARHREHVLKTLLRELSHRSKNLLAIIQGIATQTARQAQSLDVFLTKFRGRIQSLSNSQDLVTDSSWRGAFLFELVQRQLAPYWPDGEFPATLSGIDAHLSPNAALHVGLALHELIVNSASHGTLAHGLNALSITCAEIEYRQEKAVLISWVEQRPVSAPGRDMDYQTFARTVLERVVPIAINGQALYLTEAATIEYHLTVPEREFEILKH